MSERGITPLDAAALTRAVADLEDEKDSLTKKHRSRRAQDRVARRRRRETPRVAGGDGARGETRRVGDPSCRRFRARARGGCGREAPPSRREAPRDSEEPRGRGERQSRHPRAPAGGDGARSSGSLRDASRSARGETTARTRAWRRRATRKTSTRPRLRERASEVNALTASVEEDERFVERKEKREGRAVTPPRGSRRRSLSRFAPSATPRFVRARPARRARDAPRTSYEALEEGVSVRKRRRTTERVRTKTVSVRRKPPR